MLAVPFKYLGMSFELKFLPDNVSLLAIIILSPALIPAFILGPPLMGSTTVTESLIILNCIQIPTNFPCILSCTSCKFSFGMYAEWGSSFPSMSEMAASKRLEVFMVST